MPLTDINKGNKSIKERFKSRSPCPDINASLPTINVPNKPKKMLGFPSKECSRNLHPAKFNYDENATFVIRAHKYKDYLDHSSPNTSLIHKKFVAPNRYNFIVSEELMTKKLKHLVISLPKLQYIN